MSTINYTARLHSTTADKILAHVDELYDTTQGKFQSAINAEVKKKLESVDSDITNKISGVYRPKGTMAFAEVMALTPEVGDVYDIPDEFTLNGKKYPAYTNIVAIKAVKGESSWDALGGTVNVQDILGKAASDATTKANNAKSAAIADAKEKYVPKKGTDRLITEDEAKQIQKATQIIGEVVEFDGFVFSGEIKTQTSTASGSVVWHSAKKQFCYKVGNAISYELYSNWSGKDGTKFPLLGCLKTIYRAKDTGTFYIGVQKDTDEVLSFPELVVFQALNDIVSGAHTESEKKADKTSVYTKAEVDSITNPIKETVNSASNTATEADRKATAAQQSLASLQEKVTALENLLKLV